MIQSEATTARPPRNQALDGARGVAVALVVGSHWSPAHVRYGGAVGVIVFFVLSGYLITSILLAEHAATGRIDLRAFYTRRALRLFPALALLVVALPFLQKLVADPQLTYGYLRWAGETALYLGDFVRSGGGTLGPLDHTWSLAVEEQFYLVWPLVLLALLFRARGDAAKLLRSVAALAAMSAGWTVLAAFLFPFVRTYYAPDTNAFALMAGCALAAWLRVRPQAPARSARPTWIALAVVGALAFFPSIDLLGLDLRILSHAAVLYGLAAIVLIVAAVRCPDRGPLVWKPVTWLGTLSYGVYLWHEALIRLMPGGLVQNFYTRGVAIALGIGVAALSYYLLELPLLRLKKRFEFRPAPVNPVRDLAEVPAPVPAAIDAVDALVPAQREEPRARVVARRGARTEGTPALARPRPMGAPVRSR